MLIIICTACYRLTLDSWEVKAPGGSLSGALRLPDIRHGIEIRRMDSSGWLSGYHLAAPAECGQF